MAVALVLSVPAAAFGGPPLSGLYDTEWGGLLHGRLSESWVGGGQGQVGNTLHVESWDRSALGTEWRITCPAIAEPPQEIGRSLDAEGNGYLWYRTVYEGGQYWFSGLGPWGNGEAEYSGDLEECLLVMTLRVENFAPVDYRSFTHMLGYFDNDEVQCFELTILNPDEPRTGPLPADYPPFLSRQDGCAPQPGGIGEWAELRFVQLQIHGSSTRTDGVSWGTIKGLYR